MHSTIIRPASPCDLPAIEALRRKDGDSLGFIPKIVYEFIAARSMDRGRWPYRSEWLLVAEDNDEVTGYVFAAFRRSGAHITQICIRHDARRMERAMLLESAIAIEAERRQCVRIKCRVAFDIEANHFWRAIGYEPVRTVISTWLNLRESKCKRPLIVYERALTARLLFGFTAMERSGQGLLF